MSIPKRLMPALQHYQNWRATARIPFSKPYWVHKTGHFVRALYARGRGPHYADIITEIGRKDLMLMIRVESSTYYPQAF